MTYMTNHISRKCMLVTHYRDHICNRMTIDQAMTKTHFAAPERQGWEGPAEHWCDAGTGYFPGFTHERPGIPMCEDRVDCEDRNDLQR